MNNNIFNDFSDYDEQSQKELQDLNFISFEDMQKGIIGKDPFADIRVSKIQLGETIRGMTNVHPLVTQKFNNRTTQEISKLYFPDAEKQFFINQGINIDIDVDCDKAKKLLIDSATFFYDRNKNNIYDEGEFAFNISLFASKNALKLKEAFECVNPKNGEVLIFIEDNIDDWSKQIVRIKIANDVKNALKAKNIYDTSVLNYINKHTSGLTPQALKLLVETGQIEEKLIIKEAFFTTLNYVFLTVLSPLKAVGWLLEKVGKGIDFLKLLETVWDAQNENYILKQQNIVSLLTINTSGLDLLEQSLINDKSKLEWNDFIPDYALKKIKQVISSLKTIINKYNLFIEAIVKTWATTTQSGSQVIIALIAGLYNGFIDFIASTIQFLGQLTASPFDVANNWQEFLETIDNIFESIKAIDFNTIWEALKSAYNTIKTKLSDSEGQLDWVRIAYIIGFAIVFIGSMFVPIAGWLGKIAKLNKIIPQELLTTMQKALFSIKQTGKNIKQSALRSIEYLFALFAKGKTAIQDFFTKLANAVAQWFLKNKNKFKLVDKVEDAIQKYIRILKDDIQYLKALNLVKTPIKQKGHGRHLGRWLAVESEAMVKMYTSFKYKLLNEALNQGKKLSKELKAMKEVLDDALTRLPISKYNKTHTLLRSAEFSEREIKKLFKAGKEWTSKGFFSTTYSQNSLLTWMAKKTHHNVIFKVKGKNGKLIEKAAYDITEHEILFKSGTTFVVESVNKGARHPLDINKKIIEIIIKEK